LPQLMHFSLSIFGYKNPSASYSMLMHPTGQAL